ncbi:MAG: hypothetical protein WCD81_07520 [Candidatus Bathyarchaeia archaeon]
MSKNDKIREFGEWYQEVILLSVRALGADNRIRVLDVTHYDVDTEEPFWHGIKFQRISKSKKGKWRYREKLNIPFDHFSEFCDLVLKIKEELGQIT